MTGLSLGLSLGVTSTDVGGGGTPSDPTIAMLAHRVQGAGFASGAAPLTGDGTQKTHAANYVNDSGAAISIASIMFQGWTLRTTGTTDASATFTPSGTIEYPVGTPIGTIPATAVTPGSNTASANITLSASIPTGGTFRVSLAATPANGATYIANLGFAGLRNHALRSTLKKAAFAGFGDSIFTNNGGSLYNAALTRCPAYINSISGTTAQTYATGGNFTKQSDLAFKLGCTDVLVNWGTNDLAGGRTAVQLQGDFITMRDMVRALGMKWNQCTILPRTTENAAVSATMTSSGNTITATVADASKFRVGRPYFVAGANEAEYNNSKICIARDTGANTVSLHFQGSATTPATGTITIDAWKATSETEFMTALWPGAGSVRGLTNAWIRGGNVDGVLEWGDACEVVRDSCVWKIAGEDALLPEVELVTVSSVISTSRFNSNYTRGSSTIPNGFVVPFTGANIGVTRNGNGNTNGDITVSSAWTNTQQIGDQYYCVPGVSYMSDDSLHPRVSGGNKGGQAILDAATAAWLTVKLT